MKVQMFHKETKRCSLFVKSAMVISHMHSQEVVRQQKKLFIVFNMWNKCTYEIESALM